jgi:hypothetical protein
VTEVQNYFLNAWPSAVVMNSSQTIPTFLFHIFGWLKIIFVWAAGLPNSALYRAKLIIPAGIRIIAKPVFTG